LFSCPFLPVRKFWQAVVRREQFHLVDGDLVEAGEAFGLGQAVELLICELSDFPKHGFLKQSLGSHEPFVANPVTA